ncbi:MAG TPA: glycosyltransferase [Candidatus Saccharimonadales bacterium]|nr:glycosyltransferase [Candidatus Saccharimonadales bacterium]
MNPEISVIIPALNEEGYIAPTLAGLRKQTFKSFETIVVDGGSKDRTVKLAERSARVILEKRKGPAVARNAGARIARGRILLFLDADTRASPNLLATYHEKFKSGRTVAATGPIMPLERSNFLVRSGYWFVSMVFVRASIMLHRPCIVGANFAVRRDMFRKAKGFNPKMITYEDWDLSLKLKRLGGTRFIKKAIVYTSVRRIREWGVFGFFRYYMGNIARYTFLKKPKEDYNPVR